VQDPHRDAAGELVEHPSSFSAGRPIRTTPASVAPTKIDPSGESWRSKATSMSPSAVARWASSLRTRPQAPASGAEWTPSAASNGSEALP